MKRISTIALAVSVLSSCTDRSCTINGNISGLEGEGWVYLKDASNGFEAIDSARYNNGTFTLEMEEVEFETFVTMECLPDVMTTICLGRERAVIWIPSTFSYATLSLMLYLIIAVVEP